jgi:hypothetical protein
VRAPGQHVIDATDADDQVVEPETIAVRRAVDGGWILLHEDLGDCA